MRVFAFALASVIVSSALVACGSADLSSVAEAAARTEEARTARIAMNAEVEGSPEPQGARGVVDFENRTLELEIDGLGWFILDGSTAYVSAPEYIQKFTNGKRWLKSDLEDEPVPGGEQSLESLFRFFDPSRILAFVRDAADIEEVGSEDVRGVSTVHYRGTIDIAAFVAEFTPSVELETVEVADEISVEAWVGDDGFLRRFAYDVPAIAAERAGRLELEFYDIGEDVEIAIPPADEVADLSEMAKEEDKS